MFAAETIQGRKLFKEIRYIFYVMELGFGDCEGQVD